MAVAHPISTNAHKNFKCSIVMALPLHYTHQQSQQPPPMKPRAEYPFYGNGIRDSDKNVNHFAVG